MSVKTRINLDKRIKVYFVDQIRKDAGEDFKLIEDRVDRLIEAGSLRDIIQCARKEIRFVKNLQHLRKSGIL